MYTYDTIPEIRYNQRNEDNSTWIATEFIVIKESPPLFRDVPFAIVFILQLAYIIYLGASRGSLYEEILQAPFLKQVLLYTVIPCVAFAFIVMIILCIISSKIPCIMVRSGLCLSALYSLSFSYFLLISFKNYWAITAAILIAAFGIHYTNTVWRLTPFAGAYLKAGLFAMRMNLGVFFIAFSASIITLLWCLFWLSTAKQLLFIHKQDEEYSYPYVDDETEFVQRKSKATPILFLLLLSLYWTATVVQTIVQTTVAGTVGTWCFNTDSTSSCSTMNIVYALYQSLTFSFGSICFGSLFQGTTRVLRFIVDFADQESQNDCNGQDPIIYILLRCLLRCIHIVIDQFNQWSQIFVGIYRFSYLEAGKKVVELFRKRGWTSLITNNLVGWALEMLGLVVCIFSGVMGLIIEWKSNTFHGFDSDRATFLSFWTGFVVGLVMVVTMTNVIQTSANSIIVCFADAPTLMELNHPTFVHNLACVSMNAFPECGGKISLNQNLPF